MVKVYPIVLTPGNKIKYVVSVPDCEINTQGDSLAEAIFMARDAIGMWGICRQDAGHAIPEPSITEPPHEDDELVSWVDIDFERYRRECDMSSERTTVTLPRYLKSLAQEEGLNLSQELQYRLKEVLQLSAK